MLYDGEYIKRNNEYLPLHPSTVIGGSYIIERYLSFGGDHILYDAFDTLRNKKCGIIEFYPECLCRRALDGLSIQAVSGADMQELESMRTYFVDMSSFLMSVNDIEEIQGAYDMRMENNTVYRVVDVMDGYIPLHKALKVSMTFDKVNAIFYKVASGVLQMHRKGFVIGNLTPLNIYVDMEREDIKILIDFAVTNCIADGKRSPIVTPPYAATELYMIKSVPDFGTDVYAMAAMIYQALTGQRIQECLCRDTEAEMSVLKSHGYPAYIERALRKALVIDPKKRTKTVEKFMKNMHWNKSSMEEKSK